MIKSFFAMLWAFVVVAWKAIGVALFGIVFGCIWLVKFLYMFVFMIVGVLVRYAVFGFKQGWRLSNLEDNDES